MGILRYKSKDEDRETVQKLVGLDRSQIWRLEQEGDFPRRIQLGKNTVGWDRDEVLQWIESRKQARFQQKPSTAIERNRLNHTAGSAQ